MTKNMKPQVPVAKFLKQQAQKLCCSTHHLNFKGDDFCNISLSTKKREKAHWLIDIQLKLFFKEIRAGHDFNMSQRALFWQSMHPTTARNGPVHRSPKACRYWGGPNPDPSMLSRTVAKRWSWKCWKNSENSDNHTQRLYIIIASNISFLSTYSISSCMYYFHLLPEKIIWYTY